MHALTHCIHSAAQPQNCLMTGCPACNYDVCSRCLISGCLAAYLFSFAERYLLILRLETSLRTYMRLLPSFLRENFAAQPLHLISLCASQLAWTWTMPESRSRLHAAHSTAVESSVASPSPVLMGNADQPKVRSMCITVRRGLFGCTFKHERIHTYTKHTHTHTHTHTDTRSPVPILHALSTHVWRSLRCWDQALWMKLRCASKFHRWYIYLFRVLIYDLITGFEIYRVR